MSRVGRLPIAIPIGVAAAIPIDNVASVKDPKDELAEVMNKDMNIAVENNQIVVTRPSDQKEHRALYGLIRALINNIIIRVEKGFEKSLELIGVGCRAQLQGKKLVTDLGYSHPVEMEPIEGVIFETSVVTKAVVKGTGEEKVGVAAVDTRSWRKPEPYKGKGVKYDNGVIGRKEGKIDRKQ